MIALFLTVNALVLATSAVMEANRRGSELPFDLWEPFVWEYSSALSILLLIPPLHWLFERYPLSWLKLGSSVPLLLAAATSFSVAHVSLMVAMRKALYLTRGWTYNFGSLPYEFFYEFRKDVMTFSLIVILIYGYRYIVSRLMGEANLVTEQTEGEVNLYPPRRTSRDRLLVKKLGKEFIVKLEDVEWMEASGNYVNLHIKDRIYPIRKTLAALTEEIAEKGFCRIHRSHAINLDAVDSITPQASGDSEVRLRSGKVLNISRRYKDELKRCLL